MAIRLHIFIFLLISSSNFVTAFQTLQVNSPNLPDSNRARIESQIGNSLEQENNFEEGNEVLIPQKSKTSETTDFGVTIINHGSQFFGSTPFAWMIEMAEAIRNRAGLAKILKYNKSTGIFDVLPGYDSSGETILLFDWVSESDNPSSGFSEAAADALFSALILGAQNGDFLLENLHFIGHSRGCSVNSEAVERLLKIEIPVSQVTNLDPHDWGNTFIFQFATDYDVNDISLVIADPAARSPNSGVVSWEGIGWIDTYWQTSGFGGRSVYGSYNLQLLHPGIDHSGVHEWYEGTINQASGSDSWYQSPYPARNESGYNYSRIGGLERPAETGTRQSILFNFETQGIVNGDFQRGPGINQTEYPGWSDHGGGGSGRELNNELVLGPSQTSREHNRIYIPDEIDLLKLFIEVSNTENGSPPAVDKFKLSIKSLTTSSSYNLLFEEYTNESLAKWIELDISAYKNTVSTLLLELVDGGGNGINSEIQIDSISLSKFPLQLVNIFVNLEGPYINGMMKTDLFSSSVISNSQPYNVSPWNYDGTERVVSIPIDVVDWVLIELRDKNDYTNIVSTRAAFLLETGKIVDLDGSSPVSFYLPSDNYYIAVKHRNHLEVMSSTTVEITNP